MREAAWVVLCSGFSESAVRRVFAQLSLCFFDWESAQEVSRYREHCRVAALSRFRNARKIDAILCAASFLCEFGFAEFKSWVLAEPFKALRSLPYIGPVTVFHLAKNLGIPVAKPDRHLMRIATQMGYSDVQSLCGDVASFTGEPIQVVDIVFWRYAERFGTSSSPPAVQTPPNPKCSPYPPW